MLANRIHLVQREVSDLTQGWDWNTLTHEYFGPQVAFADRYRNDLALPLALNHPFTIQQILPAAEGARKSWLSRLRVPFIRGLPIDGLLRLMREDEEPFSRFQTLIGTFIKESHDAASADALVDLVRYVDDGIGHVRKKWVKVCRKAQSAGYGAVLTSASIGLNLFAPDTIGAVLATLIGAPGVLTVAREASGAVKSLKNVRQDDFYLPWLVASKGLN